MNMIAELFLLKSIIERGLIFAFVTASIYFSSRIISFDDLTVEGSFGLGGALTAWCLLHHYSLWITFPMIIISGGLAGLATGILHTKLKCNNLLSGIIVTTALFSINLSIAGSQSVIHYASTLFSLVPSSLGNYQALIILLPLIGIVLYTLCWLLTTQVGFLMQAVGNNPQIITTLGKNKDSFIILALVLANGLTALAGSLFVQYLGYFSIWGSVGTLIVALASLILGQAISSGMILQIICGPIMYQTILSITLELNIDQNWNKLITAVLITFLIALKRRQS
jgi:putative ABC transport system permease protein